MVEDGGLGARPILPETEALEEEGDNICLEVDMVTRNLEFLPIFDDGKPGPPYRLSCRRYQDIAVDDISLSEV